MDQQGWNWADFFAGLESGFTFAINHWPIIVALLVLAAIGNALSERQKKLDDQRRLQEAVRAGVESAFEKQRRDS